MSTNTQSKRIKHNLEFKKQAVQLLNTSGQPLAQVARELGLPVWQLRDWKNRLQPELAKRPETLEAMRLRLAELERENLQLRQQRDILKNFGHRLDHVTDRYQRIETMETEYPLSALCEAFGVSCSGYHVWCGREPSACQQANARLLAEIHLIRQGPEACYGSPRMTQELQHCGHACREHRVARLMRAHGLRAQAASRFVPRTTDSDHDLPSLPITWLNAPLPTARTKSGCKTSPMCPRRKAGCIWHWRWTYGVGRLSAGRWPIICAVSWSWPPCKWPRRSASRVQACWPIRIVACNTPFGKPGSFWIATAGSPA
jgi:transposase-like protein